MPLPTVGTAGLNTVKLTPQVRKILRRRAQRAAQREYAPILAADRAAFGTANAAYRTQKRSVRGATSMVQNSLSQALRGLRGSGLKGSALRQVRSELTSRQAAAAQAIPALLADAGAERAQSIQEARTNLLQDRAQMQSTAASGFNQLLKEARTAGASTLKDREKGPSSEESDSLRQAALALERSLNEWEEDPKKQRSNPLKSDRDWLDFAAFMEEEYEGVNLTDAVTVINRFRALQKKARKIKDAVGSPSGWG